MNPPNSHPFHRLDRLVHVAMANTAPKIAHTLVEHIDSSIVCLAPLQTCPTMFAPLSICRDLAYVTASAIHEYALFLLSVFATTRFTVF